MHVPLRMLKFETNFCARGLGRHVIQYKRACVRSRIRIKAFWTCEFLNTRYVNFYKTFTTHMRARADNTEDLFKSPQKKIASDLSSCRNDMSPVGHTVYTTLVLFRKIVR